MIGEIQQLLDEYVAWLKKKTYPRQVNEKWVEITTPHLDRHNDYLQIYAKIEKDGIIVLSDDSATIDDLRLSGCDLKSVKRQELLRLTLNGFGVKLDGDALIVKTRKEHFPMQKHNLVQAILAVNDMFYLSVPWTASLFFEDVANWLDASEIRHTPRVKFTGKTGYDHMFDFVIPKSRRQPERILQAINRPTRDRAESLVFAWLDTKEVRPADSKAYAILNDSELLITPSVEEAFRNYSIEPVPWSKREIMKEELAA